MYLYLSHESGPHFVRRASLWGRALPKWDQDMGPMDPNPGSDLDPDPESDPDLESRGNRGRPKRGPEILVYIYTRSPSLSLYICVHLAVSRFYCRHVGSELTVHLPSLPEQCSAAF